MSTHGVSRISATATATATAAAGRAPLMSGRTVAPAVRSPEVLVAMPGDLGPGWSVDGRRDPKRIAAVRPRAATGVLR